MRAEAYSLFLVTTLQWEHMALCVCVRKNVCEHKNVCVLVYAPAEFCYLSETHQITYISNL